MKQRASSRLSTPAKKTTTSSSVLKPIDAKVTPKAKKRSVNQPNSDESIQKKYLKQLPTLFISIPFYFVVYYIITTIQPVAVKHVLIPNTYLPLQIPLFMANFFFFSFLFLKTRRGFLMSLYISLLLFFKLQNIIFEWWWVLLLSSIFMCIEALFSLLSLYIAKRS